MPQYKLTTLSPVHITGTGAFELHYNMLIKDGYAYLYDEFDLVHFFRANGISVSHSFNELKNSIERHKEAIIASNLHLRRSECHFKDPDKPFLEQLSTNTQPILSGSSIKGALRTAILECIYNKSNDLERSSGCDAFFKLMKNKKMSRDRFQNEKGKNIEAFDKDFADLFKHLKVTDSLSPLKTQVYKSVNMKKKREYQENRTRKVEEIANYVEAIRPQEESVIEIDDTHEAKIFDQIATMCNNYYRPLFAQDNKHYFSNQSSLELEKKLPKDVFLINIGRFAGAKSKSLNKIRWIKMVKGDDKSETTARTFALKNASDNAPFFNEQLFSFGWIACRKIEHETQQSSYVFNAERAKALDTLNEKIQDQIARAQQEAEKKERDRLIKEADEKEKAKAEAAALAAMSPLERLLKERRDAEPSIPETTLLFKLIESDEVPDRCEALKVLQEKMVGADEWKPTTLAKKPEKDKSYQKTLKIQAWLKACKEHP